MSIKPAKIITEGRLEQPSDDDFSGVAIPFEVTALDGAVVLRVCDELEETAREFAGRFHGSETSAEAEEWIAKAAAPVLQRAGLEPSGECGRMRVLRFEGSPPLRAVSALASPFDPAEGYENRTSFDLREYYDMGLRCFVSVADGKIVSAAVQSPCGEGADTAEIGVETNPDYEGRGYATACVRALATDLYARGIRAVYIAQENNPASFAVAYAAGFTECGSILQLICVPSQ